MFQSRIATKYPNPYQNESCDDEDPIMTDSASMVEAIIASSPFNPEWPASSAIVTTGSYWSRQVSSGGFHRQS